MNDASALFENVSPVLAWVMTVLYLVLLAGGTATALLVARSAVRNHIDWNAHSLRLNERPLIWKDVGLLLGIFLILILATICIAALLKAASPVILLLIQSLGVDVAGLVALAWYLRTRGLGWNQVFSMRPSDFPRAARIGLIFYLAILPLVFFSSFVYQGILTVNGYPPTLQDIALVLTDENDWWVRLHMLFMAVILAPLFEECVFRGLLLPLMARRLGVGPGILVSSLLFASIHFHLPSMVPLTVVAVGFSMGYLYSGSLWVPVTMHALFNGINLGLLLLIRQ
jgi:membrane protease YdiL (CAAX protease family)